MCLLTNNPEYKIAKEPVKVWKVLLKFKNEKIKTLIMETTVKIGDTLYAKDPDKPLSKMTVPTLSRDGAPYKIDSQGVHAYTSKETAKYVADIWSQENLDILVIDVLVTEWEIPIGAKYWESDYLSPDQIAATEMKFIKICNK